MKTKDTTQLDLLKEYYRKHPNKDIPHSQVVDWAVKIWKERTGNTFRDPDRGIRSLFEKGFLKKIKKGVYRYEPGNTQNQKSENFTSAQKNKILKRDKYKCVQCGQGKREGLALHVDHIKPKNLGGKATIKNGQTLCSRHNMLKKNLKQTETGKKMFIRLYNLAKDKNDRKIKKFCADILNIYKKHSINGHIKWKK